MRDQRLTKEWKQSFSGALSTCVPDNGKDVSLKKLDSFPDGHPLLVVADELIRCCEGRPACDYVTPLLPLRAVLVALAPQLIHRRIYTALTERLRETTGTGKQMAQHGYGIRDIDST